MRSRLEKDIGPSWLVQFNGREEGDALGELQGVPEKLCCSNQLQPMPRLYLATRDLQSFEPNTKKNIYIIKTTDIRSNLLSNSLVHHLHAGLFLPCLR